MSAYKDKTQGTWYVSFRYIDWTGKKTQKLKRGFKTKKEALNYEKEFIRKTAADMKMEMGSFIEVYFEDKRKELKENSIRNKQHMMNKYIVPYFGTRKMNEITPADVIQWQNTIQEKGYSKTYEQLLSFLPVLRESRKNIQYLTQDEVRLLREAAEKSEVSARNRAVLFLLLFTGLRGCDIAGLTFHSIDWKNERILVTQQKTSVDRKSTRLNSSHWS